MKVFTFLPLCALLAAVKAAPTAVKSLERDPELTGGFLEGDMILDTDRTGLRNDSRRWPNGIVYYRFQEEHFDEEHRNHILRGMRIIEENSCIRFEEAAPERQDYSLITGNKGGCFSTVGYWNVQQTYNLQIYPLDQGCFRLGTIVHEFLHTLGFYHMQSASDRDDYVRIATENLQEGTEHNFSKYGEDNIDHYDEEYDYGSVMHYSAYAFSANGEKTIIALKEEGADLMGQRRGMSKSDINRLNVMYRCPMVV